MLFHRAVKAIFSDYLPDGEDLHRRIRETRRDTRESIRPEPICNVLNLNISQQSNTWSRHSNVTANKNNRFSQFLHSSFCFALNVSHMFTAIARILRWLFCHCVALPLEKKQACSCLRPSHYYLHSAYRVRCLFSAAALHLNFHSETPGKRFD